MLRQVVRQHQQAKLPRRPVATPETPVVARPAPMSKALLGDVADPEPDRLTYVTTRRAWAEFLKSTTRQVKGWAQ